MSEVVSASGVVEYPTSDGRPVAESDLHFERLVDVATTLKLRYAGRGDAYVGANLLVYDTPGNPRRHLAPDVFVAFGVANHRRDLYKLWEERAPAFVLEVTSKSTRREDLRTKRGRYAAWGVGEYFLYDPRGEYLTPALRGLSLQEGSYKALSEGHLPNGERGYFSEALGLHLWLREGVLRLHDPVSGDDLLTCAEEQRGRLAAEAENERLRADLRALRGF